MAIVLATWLVRALGAYALIGLGFAIPFITRGAGRVDPTARAGTWGFRLIILPGVVALWPYLAWRWARGATEPPEERTAHRCVASRRST